MLPANQIPTQYTNNPNDANLVIDLMFLWADSNKINNHLILLEIISLLDYTSLIVKNIQLYRIVKRKKNLLLNSWILLVILTLQIYQTKNLLKQLFKNTQEYQIINSQKISISLNTLKHGGMKNVVRN